MLDLIIKNGDCFIDGNLEKKEIGILDGKIAQIEDSIEESSKDTLDANELIVLPGCIDTQVHFREPGSTDTEDLNSGSKAAVAGGITGVITHAIAPQDIRGPWHSVKDLHDSNQLATVLHRIWLNRNRTNILTRPLGIELNA